VRIRYRILLGYLAVVGVFFAVSIRLIYDMRLQPLKSTEEAMADTAVLLASLLETRLDQGKVQTDELAALFDRAGSRRFSAQIYELVKTKIDVRVYVTDEAGTVLFDSEARDVGKDFSRWHDVKWTLEGRYGVRATRQDPDDFYSTVLYVAAPVFSGEDIAGVVTVGKPVESVKLFLTQIGQKILAAALLSALLAMILGAAVSAWITKPIRRLRDYAMAVRDGARPAPPELGHGEVAVLGQAFEEMRQALAGKREVEGYVRALAHEIKNPLASIHGAALLLKEEIPRQERERFIGNILGESERIQSLVERLLVLASLESLEKVEKGEEVDLCDVTREAIDSLGPQFDSREVRVDNRLPGSLPVRGDRFLLRHALLNLLQNAVEFTPKGAAVRVTGERSAGTVTWAVEDSGPGVPDYALARVFERFYSLRRPDSGRRSTGIGLAIVGEVAKILGGEARLENLPEGGARASLTIPA
jgi:two-component system sensor histidine kinase CreC